MEVVKNLVYGKKGAQQSNYENVQREVNLGEELRRLMHRRDIQETMESAAPFFISAAVAWPLVWLYRGWDWHTKKGKETLPLYIRKTFFQAKAIQLAVLAMGLSYIIGSTSTRNI
ncbi:uncharacterized protein LOC129241474 [Anastrepha obliqua]|uniref:uncharacterized protein LOC129241474 n=1 Tax=Anastrepha obliqua TaxID=95512 RepID=UPI0024098EEC|nr:uncharacterized protein LOC129241474 [Anastrepha obliqua]